MAYTQTRETRKCIY